MIVSHSSSKIPVTPYYVPSSSAQPIFMAITLLGIGFGAATWLNSIIFGKWLTLVSFFGFLFTLYYWFYESISEYKKGLHSAQIETSYRLGMVWFIFSEVMLFSGFFGSLWYVRMVTTPWLGDLDHKHLLWPEFQAIWPNFGPANVVEHFGTVSPLWLPTINTALLLASGLTITVSHYFLRHANRAGNLFWLGITIILGFIFINFQIFEYMHAYSELNLRFSSGIYGSMFYMLTGFHGFHVFIGLIMLIVVFFRLFRKNDLNWKKHFAFEAVSWYWHFVDVIWFGLYIFVYCL